MAGYTSVTTAARLPYTTAASLRLHYPLIEMIAMLSVSEQAHSVGKAAVPVICADRRNDR
jgi:hypothetical protein